MITNRKMKELMLSGAAIGMLLSAAPANASGTVVELAIAADLANPVAALVVAFAAANPSYSATVAATASSGTLLNSITAANGSTTWDVFLSADNTRAASLYNYTTTGHTTAPYLTIGIPFDYAVGTLAFWTNSTNTGVQSAVMGGYNTGFSSPASIAVASPSSAPYGNAASQYLATFGVAITDSSLVTTFTSVGAAFNAVSAGTPLQGFVALSEICVPGTLPTTAPSYPVSGAVNVIPDTIYSSTGASTGSPGAVTINYDALVQAGIKLVNNDTSANHVSAVNAFISFLNSPTGGRVVFKNYGFRSPA